MSRRDLAIAALLAALAFGVYAILASPHLRGYEGETAAVSEGLARGQGAVVPRDTEYGVLDEDRGEPGRVGILQPALMVPFYAAGAGLDEITSSGEDYTYRSFLARLYSAFITALTVAMLYALVRVFGRGEAWAMAIALLYAFASIALPYAGIGMEPTSTLTVMSAFLLAAFAARTANPWLFAATGIAIGLSASTRPTTIVPALAALILLWPCVRDAAPEARRRLVGALALPLVIGGVAFLAYNIERYDNPFRSYEHGTAYRLQDAPAAAVGLFVSPGKGLLWYSPLVICGLLGLRGMWRTDRYPAMAMVAGVVLGTLPFLITWWSDDTWGPRYLVSVAWMLLVPIAWWATTHARRLVVAAVAALAVWIQVTGTLVSFTSHGGEVLTGELTGVKVYGPYVDVPTEQIPYGDDPVRWVPELSPLRYHSLGVISMATETVGLGPRTLRYEPFRGRRAAISLEDVEPFVWWNPDVTTFGTPRPTMLWLIPFGGLALASGWGLWRIGAGRPPGAPGPSPRSGT